MQPAPSFCFVLSGGSSHRPVILSPATIARAMANRDGLAPEQSCRHQPLLHPGENGAVVSVRSRRESNRQSLPTLLSFRQARGFTESDLYPHTLLRNNLQLLPVS
jgi:hypothetical protein